MGISNRKIRNNSIVFDFIKLATGKDISLRDQNFLKEKESSDDFIFSCSFDVQKGIEFFVSNKSQLNFVQNGVLLPFEQINTTSDFEAYTKKPFFCPSNKVLTREIWVYSPSR